MTHRPTICTLTSCNNPNTCGGGHFVRNRNTGSYFYETDKATYWLSWRFGDVGTHRRRDWGLNVLPNGATQSIELGRYASIAKGSRAAAEYDTNVTGASDAHPMPVPPGRIHYEHH